MPRKIVNVFVLCVLLAMIFIGNTAKVAISAGHSNAAVAAGPAQGDGVETSDESWVRFEQQFPGFGGAFIGADGTLKVYMLDPKASVDGAMMSFLGNAIDRQVGGGERLSERGIEVLKGDYAFSTLHGWQQQLTPGVLALPGAVFVDNDERTNRLRIGIEDLGMKQEVEKQLSILEIPFEAAEIVEAEPVRYELRNFRRPLRGGLQINFGGFLCTLGFIADRQGVRGFVTNSHCTNVQGGVENTVYHQPSASGTTNRVGQEIADPTYFMGGSCPAGRRCRFSDSSFARVPHPSGPAVATVRGSIARPAVGSFNWNGVDTFTITAEAAPVVGQAITKVGRTTGRTTGTVQQTCATFNVAGSNITQLCQSRGSFASAGGDSGSPVFRITALPNVTLVGIHWGSGGVFSPITGIQMGGELGAVTTCSGGGC